MSGAGHGVEDEGASGGDPSSELERLRAERDRLREEVETLASRPERRARVRRILTPVLAALAVVTFTMAVVGTWARATALNTDQYVATVTPLAGDPRVQDYMAGAITDGVFEAVDVQAVITTAVKGVFPKRAELIAGPLTNAARGAVRNQVRNLLRTEAFSQFWVEANRFAHSRVLAVLDGESDTVSVQGGNVVVNLVPLINLALSQAGDVASSLLPAGVTLPEIRVDAVPAQAVARLEQALGVSLPADFGSVVVFRSDQLPAAQTAVRQFDRLTLLLVPLWLALATAALWLSPRRRRTLVQVLVGSALGIVLVRRASLAAQGYLLDQVKPENRSVVDAVSDRLTGSLLGYTGILLAVTVAVLVVALLTGPYRWSVRTRAWVGDLGRVVVGASAGARGAPVVAWVSRRRDALMVGGAAVGAVALLLADLSFVGFLVVLAVVALFEVAVFRAGTTPAEETVTHA